MAKAVSLGEAARQFLESLPAGEREASQQEVYRFVRWFGWERSLSELTPPEVAGYAEQLSLTDTDYARKLDLVRAFLGYARKQGWIETNLATHLKTKKVKSRVASADSPSLPQTILLTKEGYSDLEAELATLKGKRPQAIEEIRKAAADKDFRENAPLEAAREERGRLEGRIRELEEALKSAALIKEKQDASLKVSIGDSIILQDLVHSEEVRYTLVSPREVDPTRSRISSASPLGRALIGHTRGEVIEITVPAGKLRYQIKQIQR